MTALSIQKSGESPRARRSQDSRARLLAAARKLFVGRGYDATRPQDISREAGLGHGTFYLHFADKQACFLVFVEEARAELAKHIRTHTAATTALPDVVRATLEGIFEYSGAYPGVLETAMMNAAVIAADDAHPVTLIDLWAKEWAFLVRANRASDDLTDDEAGLMGAVIVGIIHEGSAYARRHSLSPERTIELLTQMIVKALK